MIPLFLDKTSASSFRDLVDLFPDSTFASPRRSTVPLLDYWRMPSERLCELGAALELDIISPVRLCFEYTVPVQRGKGKPSCTDLMVVASNAIIAVEAKFTESEYECVADWLGPESTSNRENV